MQTAKANLHACQDRSCNAERVASKAESAKFVAKAAVAVREKRSPAGVKRRVNEVVERMVSGRAHVALSRCSVTECKPSLALFHKTSAAHACSLVRARDPKARCVAAPAGKGLTPAASRRYTVAVTRQVTDRTL
jgi:hypothetical protein